MRYRPAAAIAAAVLAAMPVAAPVSAQSLMSWGEAGGWDILVDPTLDNGCLMQAEFQQGEVVRIGFDRSRGIAYLTAFHPDWGDVVEGDTYDVSFDLDGQRYGGSAIGFYLDGVPGVDIPIENPDFLYDIAARQTLTFFNADGEVVTEIDLTGTAAALAEVVSCQEEQG